MVPSRSTPANRTICLTSLGTRLNHPRILSSLSTNEDIYLNFCPKLDLLPDFPKLQEREFNERPSVADSITLFLPPEVNMSIHLERILQVT